MDNNDEAVSVEAREGVDWTNSNIRFLIELLQREAKYSGVWFADNLRTAAALLEVARLHFAALRSDEQRAGWQPIETAPKDGQYVIVARFGPDLDLKWVKHSRWITAEEIADIERGDPDEYDAAWTDGDEDDQPIYPTHWQPVTPPTADAPAGVP